MIDLGQVNEDADLILVLWRARKVAHIENMLAEMPNQNSRVYTLGVVGQKLVLTPEYADWVTQVVNPYMRSIGAQEYQV